MAQFQILGPLEVVVDGRPHTLSSRRQRAVLAVLLVNANRVTPIDHLLCGLWSDEPPDTAVGQIQTLVWRLRGLLGDAIVTRPGGYQLAVRPGALDAEVFAGIAADGVRLVRSGRLEQAAARFGSALALWRGSAFADVRPPGDASACGLNAAIAELAEQRLAVERDKIDVELELGRHAELVSRLQYRVDAEPLREELRERLMLALYRCGRRAEALETYRHGREVLVAELGLEPGAGLQRLHARMLDGDPELDGRTAAGLVSQPAASQFPVSQLPVDVTDFIARDDVVAELTGVLAAARTVPPPAPPTVPPTVVISGVAGSGKTALAVHVAHRVRGHFPDAQLFVDLRGSDGPLPPEDVLARFLRALGEDARTLPADADERAALFRARTAGRRVLVVLDNAAGEAQIRPLLPAEPLCAVLVTSRPRLAARPHLPVARLADQLADERARLDVLRTGDLAVRSSLAASYRTLDEPQRRAFELLGALDVPDIPAWVTAPLLDLPALEAEEHLERLVEARLLDAGGSGQVRYRFHDLVRAYARELAARRPDVRAALGRAFGAWLALAEVANGRLPGGFRQEVAGDAARWSGWTDAEVDALTGDPVAWCEAERPALVAVVRQAAANGFDELAWDLACTLGRFFELREHLDDWRTTHEAALRACRAAGNRRGEAYLLRALGEMYLDADRLDDAQACFAPALSSMVRLADRHGQSLVLRAQGTALRLQGRHEEAVATLTRALEVCMDLGDRVGRAQVLHNMGALHRLAGRPAQAETSYRLALAYVLCSLGIVIGSCDPDGCGGGCEAERHLARSIELCREVGYRRGEAIALGHLGELHLRHGRSDRAAEELRLAVAGCREVGDGPGEAIGLRRLGALYLAQGNLEAARSALRQCLTLCQSLDMPAERGKALDLLGAAQAEQ